MKKKILVLDVFTNGHDAALQFLTRQNWSEWDCEIVFCGTHVNVLNQLARGCSYAVVPVRNSIVGEVREVTSVLSGLKERGYEIRVLDTCDLQINHCLIASSHIDHPEELREVISHEKAFQQCGKYLDQIGIPLDRRRRRDSTGNAVKSVARRLNREWNIGAIGSRVAAEAYHLKVLAENIQDVADNKTTFQLLENRAEVKPVTVGIVGIAGQFGRLLEYFYQQLGCTVIGSDLGSTFSNSDVVRQSDVVIFSVPIRTTPEVIRSVLEFTRPDQLLMDVTSVKQPAMIAMLESQAQVVGLHPMFAPSVSFEGQTVVADLARLDLPHWKTWVVNMLSATGAKIKWSTAAIHDRYMTTVQGIPHMGNFANALLLTETGVSVAESMDFTSPFYRVMHSLVGRLLTHNPELYASIVMENPETIGALEQRIQIEKRLVEIIRTKDYTAFVEWFIKARHHFGSEMLKEADEFFVRLLAVQKTLYGENSVILEFTQAQNKPGLLERILQVFSSRQINLTGINSVILANGRMQFAISFEQSRWSDEVRQGLEEIERWGEPRVTVMN